MIINNSAEIIFVCGASDYHSMDWYHEVKNICVNKKILLATDFADNNNEKNCILPDDKVVSLFNISSLLWKTSSKYGDLWRNLVKLLFSPMEIIGLKKLAKQNPNALFHAHSMYYIFLCWLAKVKFIATPMGSDVLVRPEESKLYKYFTKKSLSAAHLITVDSTKMQDKVFDLSKRTSSVIQNGIEVKKIISFLTPTISRKTIVSLRAFYPNYQIEEILKSRSHSDNKVNLTFIYPFYEIGYKEKISQGFIDGDIDQGRLPKEKLYSLLASSLLAISVPESDSSPRSVYEAIFCGCCVAVTYSPWIDSLPTCMRERLFIVDFNDKAWLDKAIVKAAEVTSVSYIPSQEALMEYDQTESMKKVCRDIYKIMP